MGVPDFNEYAGDNKQFGMEVKGLFKLVNEAVASARIKLKQIKDEKDQISIGNMFEMQMLMNHLSQLSEMATGVVAAMHAAIMSSARNVKQ